MDKENFMLSMKIHFGLDKKEAHKFIGHLMFLTGKGFKLDIIKFDNFLHEKFGEYEEERDMSMKDLIETEYGEAAVHFVESNF